MKPLLIPQFLSRFSLKVEVISTMGSILRTILVSFAIALPILAGGAAPVPLFVLTDRADSIFVGTIKRSTRSGLQFVLTVDIERTLKGSLKPGASVVATGTISHAESPLESVDNLRALLFLKNKGQDEWVLVPTVSGNIETPRRLFILLPATPLQRGAGEVRPVFEGVIEEFLAAATNPSLTSSIWFPAVDLAAEYRARPSVGMKAMIAKAGLGGSRQLKSLLIELPLARVIFNKFWASKMACCQ